MEQLRSRLDPRTPISHWLRPLTRMNTGITTLGQNPCNISPTWLMKENHASLCCKMIMNPRPMRWNFSHHRVTFITAIPTVANCIQLKNFRVRMSWKDAGRTYTDGLYGSQSTFGFCVSCTPSVSFL